MLATLLSGCLNLPNANESDLFRCMINADCVDGFYCADAGAPGLGGLCQQTGAGDSEAGGDTRSAGDVRAGDVLNGDTLTGDTMLGDSFVGDAFVGDSFTGDTFGGDTFVGDSFVGDSFVGDSFVGDSSATACPEYSAPAACSATLSRVFMPIGPFVSQQVDLRGVACLDASTIAVAGSNSVIFRGTKPATTWNWCPYGGGPCNPTSFRLGAVDYYDIVAAGSPETAWVVGDDDTWVQCDTITGCLTSGTGTIGKVNLRGIALIPCAGCSLHAVGKNMTDDQSHVGYNYPTQTNQNFPSSAMLNAVVSNFTCISPATWCSGVAVGDAGLVLKRSEQYVWSANLLPGNTARLTGVASPPGTTSYYIVGEAGTAQQYFHDTSADTWSNMALPLPAELSPPPNLNGVASNALNDVWAVGSCGTILHFDGSNWCPAISNTTSDLYDVCDTGTAVFAVGANGVILTSP